MDNQISILSILEINEVFELKPRVRVCYYENEKLRCVFAGSLRNPETLALDEWERFEKPDQPNNVDKEWSETYEHPAFDRKRLRVVRDFAFDELEKIRKNGKILCSALHLEEENYTRCESWAEKRITFLSGPGKEFAKRHYGSVLTAISFVQKEVDAQYSKLDKLITFNTNIRSLGKEFWFRSGFENERGCVIFGMENRAE